MIRPFEAAKRFSPTLSMVFMLGVVGCSPPDRDAKIERLSIEGVGDRFIGDDSPYPEEGGVRRLTEPSTERKTIDLTKMMGGESSPVGLIVHSYDMRTNEQGLVGIDINEANAFHHVNEPNLPVFSEVIKIPDGQDIEISNLQTESEWVDFENVLPRDESVRLSDVFQEDQLFPQTIIQVDYAWQGTQRYARVAYHPVQVNPVTGEGRVHASISADLTFIPTPEKESASFSVAALSSAEPSTIAGQPVCVLDAGPLLPPMNGNAADFALRRAGFEVDAVWKFELSETGFYRLRQEEMVASGMEPSSLIGSQFRLFCRSNEVAITVSKDGVLSPGDYIEFFGVPYDGYYSTNQIYWLGFGSGGLRMNERDAPFTDAGGAVTQYIERVVVDDHVIFRSAYEPTRDMDHWFMAGPVRETNSFYYMFPTTARIPWQTAALTYDLHMFGHTGPKKTRLKWGTFLITEVSSSDQLNSTGKVDFSSNYLGEGVSVVTVEQADLFPGVEGCYVESFTLDYPRAIRVMDEALCFALPSGGSDVHVDGFSSFLGIQVYDVTDPWKPERLTGIGAEGSPNGVRIKFNETRTTNTSYYAFHSTAINYIPRVEPVMFRNLSDTNRTAEYILITPYEFREQAYRLVKHRALEPMNVVVAPIEDIYNEFSYGIRDVKAIKQFLGYAFHHWSGEPPKYVALMGKGTADPLNRLGYGVPDYIPVPMGSTLWRWTSTDSELAMVHGNDRVVDMSIGRFPVSTALEVQAVVDKILAFEGAPASAAWRGEVLLVADNSEPGFPFKADVENTFRTNAVAGGFTNHGAITTAYLGDINAGDVYNTIFSSLNADLGWLNYMGHGAIDQWGDFQENFWNVSDIQFTTPNAWPVVSIFSCQNGAYQDPALGDPCLAEAFITAPGKGASGVFAPTALSEQSASKVLADGFSRSMLLDKQYRLGDGMLDAHVVLWGVYPGVDELSTYQIFGDPGQVVNP